LLVTILNPGTFLAFFIYHLSIVTTECLMGNRDLEPNKSPGVIKLPTAKLNLNPEPHKQKRLGTQAWVRVHKELAHGLTTSYSSMLNQI
jgi:hypothetical protein